MTPLLENPIKGKVKPNEDIKKAADILWDNVSLIDDFIAANPNLGKRETNILSSWKRCKKGTYLIERHLKKGSIFIDSDNEEVYRVCGIYTSFEEMLWGYPLPFLIDTTLSPFENCIINDGLVIYRPIIFGGNMKKGFKEIYIRAKNNGNIHTTI